MLRPLLWLAIGFGVAPVVFIALGILSIGNPKPMDFPLADISTICLYLFVGDLIWTMLGRNIPTALIGATAAILLTGYGVPALVNIGVKEAAREAASNDATSTDIGKPKVIALLTPHKNPDGDQQVETDCELLCQRLLYRGDRNAVLMGATPKSGDPKDAVGLVRYSIDRRVACPATKVPAASVMPGQIRYGNSYATSEMVESRISYGDCLIEEPGKIVEADLVAMRSVGNQEQMFSVERRAGSVAISRAAIFVRIFGAWERIGQATDRSFSRLRSPLWFRTDGTDLFVPISEQDTSRPDDPDLIEHALAPWLGWPEGMPGGSQGPPKPPLAAAAP